MSLYTVKNTYKYTTNVTVEAVSACEAKELAVGIDGEVNHDDWLYDSEVVGCVESDKDAS